MSEFYDENNGAGEEQKANAGVPEPGQVHENPVEPQQTETPPVQPAEQVTQGQTQPYSQQGYVQNPPPQQVYNYSAYSPDNPTYNRPPYPQQQYQTVEPAKPQKVRKGLKRTVAAVVAVLLVLSGVAIGKVSFGNRVGTGTTLPSDGTTINNEGAPSMSIAETPTVSGASTGGVLQTSEIAAKVAPSVVAILVYANSSGELSNEGSGVIMGADNSGTYTYIVTCAHVISGTGMSISIQLENGTQYEAEIVGYDAKTDIGVLKVKAKDLTAATFGDSDALKVGDPVYAMGNPGGTEFFGSFTGGMVSAIDRSVTSTYTMECIQHDAAINPGNSGGALINRYGQIIGINSLKIVDTQYEGMGFAIPSNSVRDVVNNLIKYGYVPNRPKLGIKYAAVSQYQQYSLLVQIHNIPSGSLIIREIDSDGAFKGTDVQLYDLITAVNGEKMTSSDVLLEKIESGKVGDKLKLTIARINANYELSTFDVEVTLVEDKGSQVDEEEETTTSPFEYYEHFFQNPYGY